MENTIWSFAATSASNLDTCSGDGEGKIFDMVATESNSALFSHDSCPHFSVGGTALTGALSISNMDIVDGGVAAPKLELLEVGRR